MHPSCAGFTCDARRLRNQVALSYLVAKARERRSWCFCLWIVFSLALQFHCIISFPDVALFSQVVNLLRDRTAYRLLN